MDTVCLRMQTDFITEEFLSSYSTDLCLLNIWNRIKYIATVIGELRVLLRSAKQATCVHDVCVLYDYVPISMCKNSLTVEYKHYYSSTNLKITHGSIKINKYEQNIIMITKHKSYGDQSSTLIDNDNNFKRLLLNHTVLN